MSKRWQNVKFFGRAISLKGGNLEYYTHCTHFPPLVSGGLLKGKRWYGENRLEGESRIGLDSGCNSVFQLSGNSRTWVHLLLEHTFLTADLQLASISVNWQHQQAESSKTLHCRKQPEEVLKKTVLTNLISAELQLITVVQLITIKYFTLRHPKMKSQS